MWIGAIRLKVDTKDARYAGTDSLVTALILRDGQTLMNLRLDYPAENDLERGASRNYDYYDLPRHNDRTRELPEGIGQDPMPYPDTGLEFSDGLKGHLHLRLRIHNDDLWIKDRVQLSVKFIRQVATSFDTVAWKQDDHWTSVGTWPMDVTLSTDLREGTPTWTLNT